jgi:hypothetical protein
MTAEDVFDGALAGTTLPPREGTALDDLARTWAPQRLSPAVQAAVRLAREGNADGCARYLAEAERLVRVGVHEPVPGCVSCGSYGAWHGTLCGGCTAEGWDEVACPDCPRVHLQRPDGYVLGGCRWALDQNGRLPAEPAYDEADEADARQQVLLDLGGER